MRAKHWLALFLILTMAVGLTVMPTLAVENLLDGTGDLIGDTVTFTVKADRETVIYTGEEEVVTFTVEVANDSDKDLHAFSFVLEPSTGLTLATLDKDDEANGDPDFYFRHGTDTDMLKYYKTFEYTPDRCYFGAAKADKTNAAATTEGSAITLTSGAKTVLTIMGKISAPGDYTLTMNTTDRDEVVVAGQVNGTGSNTVSRYFARQVTGATVHAVAGGVISGTVTDGSAAVPGAVVTLKDSQGTRVGEAVTAGNDGKFTLPAVANGAYTLDVTAQAGEKTLSGSKSVTVDGSTKNGYAFTADVTVREFELGDVNGDGTVDTTDITVLSRYVAEWPGYTTLPVPQDTADLNHDGSVDTTDITYLCRHVAEWPGY